MKRLFFITERFLFVNIFWLALFVIGVYSGYYVFLGQDAVITIHDNLDSELSFRLLPMHAGNLFSYDQNALVPQVMEGVKRNFFYNGPFNISNLFFYFLPPIWAYILNHIFVKLIAFFGVYLLLKEYLLAGTRKPEYYAVLAALGYSMLSYYTICGNGVTGVPLLAWSVLNICNQKKYFRSAFCFALFIFSSSIAIGELYVPIAFLLITGYLFYKKHAYRSVFLVLTICFFALTAIAEIHLIRTFMADHFLSNRDEWNMHYFNAEMKVILVSIGMQLFYCYDMSNYYPSHHMVMALSMLFLLVLYPQRVLKNKFFRFSFFFFIALLLLYAITQWNYLDSFRTGARVLKIYTFSKISFYFSLSWYAFLVTIILVLDSFDTRMFRVVLTGILCLNVFYVVYSDMELKMNMHNTLLGAKNITFRQFFSEDLFQKIKRDIAAPQNSYKVGSIGLFPSITQYNGFNTIDGYQNIYPLSYKHKFKKAISRELDKNQYFSNYFNFYGSRCYIFAAEIKHDDWFMRDTTFTFKSLELDPVSLKELGCSYIFSGAEIESADRSGLSFVKKYTTNDSPLHVYVYKVF